jgi:VanZ family protein
MNKYLKWAMVLTWIIIIFVFSSQPAVISDEKSKFVIKIFEILGLNLNSIWGNLADYIVRKISHFLEYLILFTLLFNAIYDKINLKKAIFISLLTVFLYACSDEVHQLFVPGRAGRFTDVMIDTSGGAMGALIQYIRIRIRKDRKVKQQ